KCCRCYRFVGFVLPFERGFATQKPGLTHRLGCDFSLTLLYNNFPALYSMHFRRDDAIGDLPHFYRLIVHADIERETRLVSHLISPTALVQFDGKVDTRLRDRLRIFYVYPTGMLLC